jgi:hypothetical protein
MRAVSHDAVICMHVQADIRFVCLEQLAGLNAIIVCSIGVCTASKFRPIANSTARC